MSDVGVHQGRGRSGVPVWLYLAWVTAVLATLGSLYLSEVRGFVPCTLCWFQRVAMYPLALQLGIGVFRADPGIRPYALALAAAGWVTALVQNLEMWGLIKPPQVCTVGSAAPCDVVWPVWSGLGLPSQLDQLLSVPALSLLAFSLICGLLAAGPRWAPARADLSSA